VPNEANRYCLTRGRDCEPNVPNEPNWPGLGPMPSNAPAREVRVRKFPNTVKEETYDPHWGRWVWTGYVYANKDSNPADAGRCQ
jgi:hypothetical protein